MNSTDARPQFQAGTGMVQNSAYKSSKSSKDDSKVSKVSAKKVDTMMDSYLTSVTSSKVICVDSLKMNASQKSSITGSSKNQDPPFGKTEDNSFDTHNSMSPDATDSSETPSAIPGLSIITWDEFIEEPSLLHNLFSMDKDEFIHFDSNVINNFFHDSRMEPPLLGGPSGDALSWTIFVDSYSQLKEVREFITTRISVLLVDLVKPNNSGTASCLIAINPLDDHIRRVLHLTLSRAMETVFAERSFSVEIDLNESVRQWCQSVLHMDCQVQGGRLVVTNGDPVESFCLVESPLFCVLAFPVWLYRRVKYVIHRKRHYDDTLVKFEGANFVLCTRSETLRKYSEAMQLSSGDRLIHRNDNAVTTATQTINASTPSLDSELSVQEIEEASDNDAIKRRGLTSANETLETRQHLPNPSFQPEEEDDNNIIMECESGAGESAPKVPHGRVNKAFSGDERDSTDSASSTSCVQQKKEPQPIRKYEAEKVKSVRFNSKEETAILDPVAQANLAEKNLQGNNSAGQRKAEIVKNATETGATGDQIPSPRTAFLLRPDTPFQPKPKPRKSKIDSPSNNSHSAHADINDKIVKRQKKISNLLKDLISFNTSSYNAASEHDDDVRGSDNENEIDVEPNNSHRISKNNFFSPPSKPPVKAARRISQNPVKSLKNSQTSPVFPYTSDLLNFPALSDNEDVAKLERYGARLKKDESSSKKKPQNRREEMMFMPRLNLEEVDPDRNCFSDQDVAADSDLTDLEQEHEGVVSDTEGILSARLIPVYSTERTLSMDSVNNNGFKNRVVGTNKSDLDSDLEITDCEIEEHVSPRQMNSLRILPGALAAQQLRSSSANARSRDYIPPNVHANRRGGTQNDSRRRYLALNSLRRRAYKLALQSQIRNQSRPSSAELVSYNNIRPASGTHVTIMSKV